MEKKPDFKEEDRIMINLKIKDEMINLQDKIMLLKKFDKTIPTI